MQMLNTCWLMPSQFPISISQAAFQLIYILNMTLYGMEYPSLWPAGVCCPDYVTAQLLVLPTPSASSLAGLYEKLKSLT